MAALHVVGVDFQLRLGVHAGFAGGAEVAVGLLRVGVLRAGTHQDEPGESARGLVVEHVLEELVRRAAGHGVVNARVVVHVLVLVGDGHAAEVDFSPLASQSNIDGVARRTARQGHTVQ